MVHSGLPHYLHLLIKRGIVQSHIEHEAVELCFRQRIGAFLFDGILGRKNEKGIGQCIGTAADRHLLLLHRFQQRSLRLGGRAVDFIGKDDIGEDRALYKLEIAILIKYFRPRDVRRHQIGSELYAAEGKS